ncbi:Indoleamine 2,3-dioxygenase [Suillus subalutaceus]|uniref:Indoleamine 2,3-dioxygenase n=1 Tax=Suillus subalutaceus TaxID=48586 RepID=UPI001B86D7AA|nr:Indoleamine 2,3-dioxygenase [Suillus subalutaceus]KAG1877683.1 Indoleamine 2,3-dioxygenase [Suillus subalutaceus]KAG1891438.1 Indoleamine 2,3-dioxygenase [Suillus subluteus]
MYPIDLLSPSHLFSNVLSVLNSVQLLSRKEAPGAQPTPADFEVNLQTNTGFLPEKPIPRLPAAYSAWENALTRAQEVLVLGENLTEQDTDSRADGELWRSQVRGLPVISINDLKTDTQLLRRAHKVLAFLVHFYVHSTPPDQTAGSVLIPRSLATPLLEVSNILRMAPVLTFADTVLWNWDLVNPELPVTIENMRFGVELFSGTEDERNFWFGNAKVEMLGVEMLHLFNEYHSLPNVSDFASVCKINRLLTRLVTIVDRVEETLTAMRDLVDPSTFYWQVRPWFNGSASGSSSPTWVFEDGPDASTLDLSGPSAGQSSVMHALDIFLDVDFKLQQRRYPAPSEANKRSDLGFMERMRRYMPGAHRDYLSHLANTTRPLRELAKSTPAVKESYNAAVSAVRKFRDSHIRIACLYVVSMSRSTAIPVGCPVFAMMQRMERQRNQTGHSTGTGGNELSLLLKSNRDATARAAIKI